MVECYPTQVASEEKSSSNLLGGISNQQCWRNYHRKCSVKLCNAWQTDLSFSPWIFLFSTDQNQPTNVILVATKIKNVIWSKPKSKMVYWSRPKSRKKKMFTTKIKTENLVLTKIQSWVPKHFLNDWRHSMMFLFEYVLHQFRCLVKHLASWGRQIF